MPISIPDARARVLLKYPYYASIVMRLRPVKKPGLGTMGVLPDLTLWYDPDVNWTLPQTAAVLIHELNHILRDHAGRKQDRDHRAWNVACDAEINDGGIPDLPADCVTPQTMGWPNDLHAEAYYDKIPKVYICQQPQPGQQPPPQGGQGQPPPPGQGQGKQLPKGCGSPSCTGKDEEGKDLPQPKQGKSGQSGVTPIEVEAMRKEVADQISKNPGNVPGGLRRWATKMLTPKPIPWHHLLSRGLSNVVARSAVPSIVRYPGRRPSANFLFPRWRGTRPTVAAVIDTSGSITDDDLAIAIKVVQDMSDHADPIIFSCDTEAHRVQRLTKDSLIGGGGTDMGAGIEASVKEGKGRLAAIVIVTDCYTPWPDKSPGVPVWVITTNAHTEVPKWTKKILINSD